MRNGSADRDGGEVVVLCADETVRGAVAFWLKDAGWRVVVAQDGHAADLAVRQPGCRLLITDRVLPPWPGLDTVRALRSRRPDLGVAVVESGHVDDRILARVSGATALVKRPLTREAVLALLASTRSPTSAPAVAPEPQPQAGRAPTKG
ncbi:response regulator [Rhodoplanes serenus]|uniref:Response regulator n=1 Tax=Rhodoplanes serenus TaxID=200615 RepID=A0A9X5AV60_9BRAD|nr:response regulator [Rhodoplanes serenus]MTW19204.1 response regulator [Rhodoplanes serenus]